ncbi:hypothetical protein QE152_g39321 [Popillia japonica]|uniref:Tf2-1-like SH3-like domain-containing protein n=1 Tax=Popillia japonica TaxID=7064 RepID=A0AAW1HUF7_POPJA
MRADVAGYIRRCSVCIATKPEQKKPAGLYVSQPIVNRPWQMLSMDLIGPLPRSSKGVTDIDYATRAPHFQKLYLDIQERLRKAANTNRHNYNLRRRQVEYTLGQPVYRKNHVLSDASKYFNAKLAPKFVGPFYISRRVSPWTYELKDSEGIVRGIWHASDLKPVETGEAQCNGLWPPLGYSARRNGLYK